jgi:hypothetical protein
MIVGGPTDRSSHGAAWIFTRTAPADWVQQGTKLWGTGYSGLTSQQGRSVAISSDGNTAASGALGDNGNRGAAWIFVRSGGVWSQQGAKLVGTGEVGTPQRGTSIALSATDGNTLALGGPADNTNVGAVWIFTRSGTTWSQQGSKLVGTGNTGASRQGFSVALSADGNTLASGGYSDNTNQGAAWIFTRSGTTWTQEGSALIGTGNTGAAQQGISISLSADGNTLAVGGYTDNTNQGAVWIYTRTGGVWTQLGSKLVGTGNTGAAQQGASVSLSPNGNNLAIGGILDASQAGATWIFTQSGGVWTQQGSKLVGTGTTTPTQQGTSVWINDAESVSVGGYVDATSIGGTWTFTRSGSTWSQLGSKLLGTGVTAPSEFGSAVAITADTTTIAVGARADQGNIGGCWAYTRSGNTWLQQGTRLRGTGNVGTGQQGLSVALASSDGNTLACGAPGDASNQGAAWIFVRSGGVWSQQGSKLTGTGGTGSPRRGQSLALSGDGNTLAIGASGDNTNQGAVWIFTRSGTTWTQEGSKLVGTGNTGAAQQGYSVALSSDGNTLASGGYTDNTNVGAVWIFTRSGTTWTQEGSKLVGTGNVGQSTQGFVISIASDGNTLAVSGHGDNGSQGAIWVFVRSGGVWSQQGSKLVGTGNTGAARQSNALAISGNGDTIVSAGQSDSSNTGGIWRFRRSAGVWTQYGSKMNVPSAGNNDFFGNALAIPANEEYSFVGGGLARYGAVGMVWVYI